MREVRMAYDERSKDREVTRVVSIKKVITYL